MSWRGMHAWEAVTCVGGRWGRPPNCAHRLVTDA